MNSDQRVSRLELVSLTNAPDLAALHARDVLRRWNWPGALDVAWLVVAELVNSAVARPVAIPRILNDPVLATARPLRLTMRWTGPVLRLELWDSDATPPQAPPAHPQPHAATGLALIAAHSSRWSYDFPPEGGKLLWCELLATPALPAGPSSGSQQPRALGAASPQPQPGYWAEPRQSRALPSSPQPGGQQYPAQYPPSQYPPQQYPPQQYPQQAGGQYANGNGQNANGQYTNGQYTGGQYTGGQDTNGRPVGGQPAGGQQHPQNGQPAAPRQYPNGHPVGSGPQYQNGQQYGEPDHPDAPYPAQQYPPQQYPDQYQRPAGAYGG